MLRLILIVTLGVPHVGLMERAYEHWLGYRVVQRGAVAEELATAWSAPRMVGRSYVLMRPESGAPIYLRFVEVDAVPDYVPMKTSGWNAVEMLVQDPDALAERLGGQGSPFEIVGVPRPLGKGSPIRAMQVVGPAKEVLYLTRLTDAENGYDAARSFVDRPFIMVLGGSKLAAITDFYGQAMRLETYPPSEARMTVLNKAYGLNIETTHRMSMAVVSKNYSIELDEYPTTVEARPTRRGELPPAIAAVTFEVDSLDELPLSFLSRPRRIAAPPYDGRRVAVVRGAAGELLELVESGAPRVMESELTKRRDPSKDPIHH